MTRDFALITNPDGVLCVPGESDVGEVTLASADLNLSGAPFLGFDDNMGINLFQRIYRALFFRLNSIRAAATTEELVECSSLRQRKLSVTGMSALRLKILWDLIM